MWQMAAEIMGADQVHDFESMAKIWRRGNKFDAVRVRNELCFQGGELVQNGSAVWSMFKAAEELEDAEQGGRSGKVGTMAQMLEVKSGVHQSLQALTWAGMDHRMNYDQSVIGLESD
jgi:hypothetical protein